MKQVLFSKSNDPPSASDTEYNSLQGFTFFSTIESDYEALIPTAGTISKLRIKLASAPGAGKSLTFTLRKNGVDQTLTVTIADTAISGNDTIHEVSVAAGDKVCIKCTPSGTPTTSAIMWTALFEGTTSKESIQLIRPYYAVSNIDTRYFCIGRGINIYSTTENIRISVIPTGGNLKKLYVELASAPDPGGSDGYIITLRKNGLSQALTVTITGDNTTGNDTANSVAVSAGDTICLKVTPTGTPAAEPKINYGLVFEATTDGESPVLNGSTNNLDAATTEYNLLAPYYSFAWTATEADVKCSAQECILKNFYVKLDDSPGTDKSYTFTLRKNGADTALTCTVADAATTANDTIYDVTISDDDELNVKVVPTGTPTVRDALCWSFVCYVTLEEDKSASDALKFMGTSLIAQDDFDNLSLLDIKYIIEALRKVDEAFTVNDLPLAAKNLAQVMDSLAQIDLMKAIAFASLDSASFNDSALVKQLFEVLDILTLNDTQYSPAAMLSSFDTNTLSDFIATRILAMQDNFSFSNVGALSTLLSRYENLQMQNMVSLEKILTTEVAALSDITTQSALLSSQDTLLLNEILILQSLIKTSLVLQAIDNSFERFRGRIVTKLKLFFGEELHLRIYFDQPRTRGEEGVFQRPEIVKVNCDCKSNGEFITPTSVEITISDPMGVEIVDSMVAESPGVYNYDYITEDAILGKYEVSVKAIYGTAETVERKTFWVKH